MGMIIDVFSRYSGSEGSTQTLTKGELKVLMEKELPGFLQVSPGQQCWTQQGLGKKGKAWQADGRELQWGGVGSAVKGLRGKRDRS